jgi:hypothetical protein
MRILLLKRGEQPVGLHAARQGRLRALSKGGDLESVTLTSVKIYPESRRFWPRFPLCADSVTLGPILGQLTAHGWIPIRADACRRIWELTGLLPRYTSMSLPYHIGNGWFAAC